MGSAFILNSSAKTLARRQLDALLRKRLEPVARRLHLIAPRRQVHKAKRSHPPRWWPSSFATRILQHHSHAPQPQPLLGLHNPLIAVAAAPCRGIRSAGTCPGAALATWKVASIKINSRPVDNLVTGIFL